MIGSGEADASVSVLVQGISLGSDYTQNAQTVYNVVGQQNGRTVYGASHMGTLTNWNDNFVVNLQSLQYDDLDLVVFANDQELGRGKLNFMDIVRSGTSSSERLPIFRNGNNIGHFLVQINKSKRQEIVGGLQPPVVSLRHGAAIVEEARVAGIQKVRAKNLNFFSCMDAKDMGWQFFPYNFETKLNQTNTDH